MGALLLIPFVLIRFGLPARLDKTALERAAHFAPMAGKEKIAYWVYQLSTAAILLYLFFLRIQLTPAILFCAGVLVFLAGIVLLVASMVSFAAPSDTRVRQTGLYAHSRNPMYVAYFVYFMGCALLTQSPVLLALLLLFQISAHWIILAEERWCAEVFGEEYSRYRKRVGRYLSWE